jgi:hypothetical protein
MNITSKLAGIAVSLALALGGFGLLGLGETAPAFAAPAVASPAQPTAVAAGGREARRGLREAGLALCGARMPLGRAGHSCPQRHADDHGLVGPLTFRSTPSKF